MVATEKYDGFILAGFVLQGFWYDNNLTMYHFDKTSS